MQCELFFYYEKNKRWEELPALIRKLIEPRQVITDSLALTAYLRKNGVNSATLDEIVPERGSVVNEVHEFSKTMLNSYKQMFQDISFNDIEFFTGFEFQFLRQLHLLGRAKKILENKINTVFIFERFYYIYFTILTLSAELGYEHDSTIKFLNGNKIEPLSYQEKEPIYYKNKFAIRRSTHFLKSSLSSSNIMKRFKILVNFSLKVISLLSKILIYKTLSLVDINISEKILYGVLKKVSDVITDSPACIFFITATREDIYLKPLYPIFDEFKNAGKSYLVISANLSTDLLLSNKDLPFINLFDDIKILTNEIRRGDIGQQIRKRIENNLKQNYKILGINELSGYFIEEACSCIATIIICEQLFKQLQPNSVYAGQDGEMLENIAVEVSKKYHIQSFSMLPAVIHKNPIVSYWFHADKICVYGFHGLETLVSLGYDKQRIIVTGHSKYDYFKSLDGLKIRNSLEKERGIKQENKLIVIGMSGWYSGDEIWMSSLIKFCNENNFEIIIKIHPMYKLSDRELSENKIKAIQNACALCRYLITYDFDIYALLAAADVVITDFSNVGIEAMLLEKPVITVNFSKKRIWDYIKLDEIGSAVYVESSEKLEDVIREILIENKHVDKLREDRQKIIELYNYRNDGRASQRIFNLLIKSD